MVPHSIRSTGADKIAGTVRVALGILFVMTGAMKLVVPMLAEAWSGQLVAADLPLFALTRWTVPLIEIGVGGALLVGAYARLASVVVIGIMTVAIYVHVVVDDPSLFPLQPSQPIVPLVVIAMCGYLLWRGGGAWSLDLKSAGQNTP